MRIIIHLFMLLFASGLPVCAQEPYSETRRKMLLSSDELLAEATALVDGKTLAELKAIVEDGNASSLARSASARLLLQRGITLEDKLSAFPAFGLYLQPGLSDWGSVWMKNYPVAAEASLRPDLMPHIIQSTLDGALPESVVGSVLLRYQTDNHSPGEHLEALLKTSLTPEQRHRGERLLAILKGETPSAPMSTGASQVPSSPTSTGVAQQPVPEKPAGTKPAPVPPNALVGEPGTSTRWGIFALIAVAALGLLWLMLKKKRL